ncbi:MAG TPA: NAD+ synthase, partial [Gammaproteobacteria bacterium]|nr:NAD+ synthase [Gammaproteobacteria bacterium]
MKKLPLAIAQLNFTVGDVEGNTDQILAACHRAGNELGCRMVVFPELAITGYPPEDLLFRKDFLVATEAALARVIREAGEICAVVGHPWRDNGTLYNAASV